MHQSLPFHPPPNPADAFSPSAPPNLSPEAPLNLSTPGPQNLVPQAPVFVRPPKPRRYLIRVTDDGTVRVTIPRGGSQRAAVAFAEQERSWIEDQLRRLRLERERPRPAPISLEDERELRDRSKRELPQRLLELAAAHG